MILLSLLISILCLAPAHSATPAKIGVERGLGLGIILGEPTGFTGKTWQGQGSKRAIDFGLAYSFGSFVLVYGDYLFHFPGAFKGSSRERFLAELSPYVGVGGVLLIATGGPKADRKYFAASTSSIGLSFRIPLGVEWLPADPPLGVFVEVVPGVGFVPRTFALLQAGIGIRYYF